MTDKAIGKARSTDEHGRPHDECDVYVERAAWRVDGVTLTLRFARAVARDAEHPVLDLDLFHLITHDLRSEPTPPAATNVHATDTVTPTVPRPTLSAPPKKEGGKP